jgi:hypothetical protein
LQDLKRGFGDFGQRCEKTFGADEGDLGAEDSEFWLGLVW